MIFNNEDETAPSLQQTGTLLTKQPPGLQQTGTLLTKQPPSLQQTGTLLTKQPPSLQQTGTLFLSIKLHLDKSSAVDRGCEPLSSQTKDYQICSCCFSAKQH
jgi:hypothetical protein